ncbi:hypothetical protein GCM10007897_42930 [Sphingobium jiangsuense]|uniref:Uncharacterized protein n=1 Tax=Sphingobium jiangsuense TaxID=870476 RepID=A0A7W6BKL3_9SPHN|nr:hypothetical protein [Sphingobium jiangsuense]MBB3928786.1 hypothetical protein [Sphingobium jiangsuense]GLT02867.1 hypothetical protein GCM10007897_42930 [Sphingobium jiangsuense]
MGEIAITVAPEPPAGFSDWVETGRTLAAKRRNVDWEIADWMGEGQEKGFLTQAGFDFLSERLCIAPKRLKDIAKAAAAFPRHVRDETLSIEHHAHVADLPRPEQMELLSKAKREHWSDDDMRKQAISRKVESGLVQTMTQADYEQHALMSLQHAYNRAPRHIRIEFIEAATEANGGEVDL